MLSSNNNMMMIISDRYITILSIIMVVMVIMVVIHDKNMCTCTSTIYILYTYTRRSYPEDEDGSPSKIKQIKTRCVYICTMSKLCLRCLARTAKTSLPLLIEKILKGQRCRFLIRDLGQYDSHSCVCVYETWRNYSLILFDWHHRTSTRTQKLVENIQSI